MVVSSWRTGIAMVKSATESGSRCLLPQCTLLWVLLPTLAANLRARVARQAGSHPALSVDYWELVRRSEGSGGRRADQ
jgi:hypothetical protein